MTERLGIPRRGGSTLKVFISYRRADTEAYAGRLYDVLTRSFGPDNVFMDVDAMRPGEDFVRAIDRAVTSADVVLVVIGRDWLTAVDERGQRRLDDEIDFVRVEIATAIARDAVVIPVLVEGARPPRPVDLPEPLQPLARRQAITIRHDRFQADAAHLVEALERLRRRDVRDTIAERSPRTTGGPEPNSGWRAWVARHRGVVAVVVTFVVLFLLTGSLGGSAVVTLLLAGVVLAVQRVRGHLRSRGRASGGDAVPPNQHDGG